MNSNVRTTSAQHVLIFVAQIEFYLQLIAFKLKCQMIFKLDVFFYFIQTVEGRLAHDK